MFVDPNAKKGYIYVIKCHDWYKIGKAFNIKERLGALQTGNPYELEIVHSIKCNDYTLVENRLHKRYAFHRGHGEWFKLPLDALNEVKMIHSM